MKTIKTFAFLASVCAAVLLVAGCKDDCSECPDPPRPETELAGTKWKLVGIVDAETGEIKKMEPRVIEGAYTLTFTTDTKADVRAFMSDTIKLDLEQLGQYEFPDNHFFGTDEDQMFCEALYNYNTKSYAVVLNQLMFINNTEKYYLLFEPYDKVVADEKEFEKNQIIGRWKLVEVWVYNSNRDESIKVDYSGKNIIYNFQDDNKLVITDPIDDLFIFDDFKEGDRLYKYRLLAGCSVCLPSENLAVANSTSDFQWYVAGYYCTIPPDKKTMGIVRDVIIVEENIGENSWGIKQGDNIRWGMSLIKIE